MCRPTKIDNWIIEWCIKNLSVTEFRILVVIWNRFITAMQAIMNDGYFLSEGIEISYKFLRENANIKYTINDIDVIIEKLAKQFEEVFIVEKNEDDSGYIIYDNEEFFEGLVERVGDYTILDVEVIQKLSSKYDLYLYYKIRRFSKSNWCAINEKDINEYMSNQMTLRSHKQYLNKSSKKLNDLGIENRIETTIKNRKAILLKVIFSKQDLKF